jgi:hypothetical protein
MTWQQVQTLLQRHRPGPGQRPARSGAWLQGLLRCAACGTRMTPSQSIRGTRQYRYYVCLAAQKRGWHTCPVPSVPAEQTERLVIDQLQGLENAPANLGSIFEVLEHSWHPLRWPRRLRGPCFRPCAIVPLRTTSRQRRRSQPGKPARGPHRVPAAAASAAPPTAPPPSPAPLRAAPAPVPPFAGPQRFSRRRLAQVTETRPGVDGNWYTDCEYRERPDDNLRRLLRS